MKIDDPIMNACVDVTEYETGEYLINCKYGFWSAYGLNWDSAFNEALDYFNQHMIDGKYDELLEEAGL